MKRTTFSTFLGVIYGVCLAASVFTAEAIKTSPLNYRESSADVIPGRYIISFSSISKNNSVQSFAKQLKDSNIKVEEIFDHELFRGISVSIGTNNEDTHTSTINSILKISDVKAIYPVKLLARPTVGTQAISEFKEPTILPHAMTQVELVHSKLRNKGKGILVGVLDTGIDYKHPALGGGFGEGYKVVAGYDLVGDAYTGSNTPTPDNDPLDNCGANSGAEGHGTHVSGIIAGYDADNNFTGVAPEASLGMWRVFGCTGTVSDDIVIKGLLMAYDAGCDVINLSLGSTNAWSKTSNVESDIIDRIVAKGVHVVIAAGNQGAQGIYTMNQPGTATGAFSIASVDNNFALTTYFAATGIKHPIPYVASNSITLKNGPIVNGDVKPGNAAEGCTPASISPEVKGKFALIKRGTCTFVEKIKNAASAGAVGVVIYNNVDSQLGASVPGITLPIVTISLADGIKLTAAIREETTIDLDFNKNGSITPISTGGTISLFSSVGASAELNFKPQIAGIGGQVFSTLPRYLKKWGFMSGTSMATPYISGTIALYLSSIGKKKKKTSVKFVQEQLQNYAKSAYVYNTTTLDSPIRQGAGLVQIYDAITQKVHITPAAISFNDSATDMYTRQSVTITNHGLTTMHYKVIHRVTVGIAPYNVVKEAYTPLEPVNNTVAKADLRFSTRNIKLSPGKSKTVSFTVTPPEINPRDHIFYGGFIQFKSMHQADGKDLNVPYFGVVGKQKELPIFDKGFPFITDIHGKEYLSNMTFVYDRSQELSYPVIFLRLLTPTAHIKANILDADKSDILGQFYTGLDYMGRNYVGANKTFVNFIWDGTYVPSSLPENAIPIATRDGKYHLQLSALKLLGDPKEKSDWETWISGPIIIKN